MLAPYVVRETEKRTHVPDVTGLRQTRKLGDAPCAAVQYRLAGVARTQRESAHRILQVKHAP